MDASKEALQQIFNSIDKDFSGFIDKKELNQLAKELGEELSEQELKKILRVIDTDGDGQISFEEFYQWWYYGKQNKLEKLIYYKFKNSKQLKKVQKKVQKKLGPFLQQKYESGKSYHFAQVNIGKFEQAKTILSAEVRVGLEHKAFLGQIQNFVPSLDENQIQLVMRIAAKNPELVKEKFSEFVSNGIELGMTMIPEDKQEMANMVKDTLQIEYSTTEDQVFVRFGIQHDLVDSMVQQYIAFASMFMTDSLSASVKAKIELKESLLGLIEQKHEHFLNLLSRGARATFDMDLNMELVEQLRNFVMTFLSKKVENNVKNKTTRVLKDLILLFLLQQSKVVLNFNEFNQFCQELDIPINKIPSQEQMLNQAKQLNVNELIANIPFIADLVEILNSECSGNISFFVIGKDLSVSIHEVAENIGGVWEVLVQQ